MSKLNMMIKKDLPLKIMQEKLNIDKKPEIILNLKSNREPKINNMNNDSNNNDIKAKSANRINDKRFLTEKKIPKLNYEKLYRLNSSSDITNMKTQNNSFKNLTHDDFKKNIEIIISIL